MDFLDELRFIVPGASLGSVLGILLGSSSR